MAVMLCELGYYICSETRRKNSKIEIYMFTKVEIPNSIIHLIGCENNESSFSKRVPRGI